VSNSTESSFLSWEAKSRDTIEVKRCYIDVAGDITAGIILSQIVYWFLPNRKGEARTTIVDDEGYRWIAKKSDDWWEECRVPPATARRHLESLAKRKLIFLAVKQFNRTPTTHIRINFDLLSDLLISKNALAQNEQIDLLNMSESTCSKRANPIKEAETTTEITAESSSLSNKSKEGRHVPFKELIFRFYQWKYQRDPDWDGSEAKQLSSLLKANPKLDVETFAHWLKNYGASDDISPGERPRIFLPKISRYSVAPLDRYGKDKTNGQINGFASLDKGIQRSIATHSALQDCLQRENECDSSFEDIDVDYPAG
jgi:hypothetical protein